MKKIILILTVLVLMTGCAEMQFAKTTIKHGGARLADESLNATIWKLCNATSYGAIKRKFGDSKEKADALHILCGGAKEVNLLIPDSN